MLTRFPGLRGKQSITSKKHHSWLKEIAIETASLHEDLKKQSKKIKTLEKSNEELNSKLVQLESSLNNLDKSPANLRDQINEILFEKENTNVGVLSYANIAVKNTISEAVVAKVSVQLDQRAKIERNVVVIGLLESENVNDERAQVVNLLRVLQIDASKVERKVRFLKKGDKPDPNKRPTQLLIEFKDAQTASLAVANGKQLARSKEFEKV